MPSKSKAALPMENGASQERLAVNLLDLDRVDSLIRQILLRDKLDLTEAIWVDKSRLDETAVAFTCDLLTAAAACDTLRSHDRRAKDFPTRVYIFRQRAWTKLPGTAVLTKMVGGNLHLNPEFFTVAPPVPKTPPAKQAALRAAPAKRVIL